MKSNLSQLNELIIISDNVRSAYNIGAIFRTLDGLGKGIRFYITGISPTPDNPKVHKTALDAEKSVPWKYFTKLSDAIISAEQEGFHIFALEQSNQSQLYTQVKYPNKLALIVGHEQWGVNEDIVEKYKCIEIPMLGIKESLNVEVATAIVSYFIAYQWQNQ